MAVVPGIPIAITGPGIYPISYPGGGTQPTGASHQWTQIKLENASPFPMTFSLGGTPVHSLPAGIADVFPLTLGPSGPAAIPTAGVDAPAQPLTVVAGTPQQTPAQSTGTLRPSFGQYGDQFPGVYPVTLPGNLFAPLLSPSAGSVLSQISLTIPAPGGGSANSGVVNVQNMAELLIQFSCTGSPASQWTVAFYSDPAGTQLIVPPYVLNVATGFSHLLPIAVLGPYCVVSALGQGAGGSQSAELGIVGLPQPVGRQVVVPPTTVCDTGFAAIAANSSVVFPAGLGPFSPGRFHIWAQSQTGGTVRLSRVNNSGVFVNLWQAVIASGGDVSDEILIGGDDWNVTLFNTGAAPQNMWATVTGPG